MACQRILFLGVLLLHVVHGDDTTASPILKVIRLLDDMAAKVKDEGAKAEVVMKEARGLCEKRGSELQYSIKTGLSAKEELEARIQKAKSKVAALGNAIEQALGAIQNDQVNLQKATDVRKNETGDFLTAEKDLSDTLGMLKKGIAMLNTKAAKGGSGAFLQLEQAPDIIAAIETMVSASMVDTEDAAGLTALLQSAQTSDGSFEALDPAAPAYTKRSGAIVEVLEELYDKAKTEITSLRKKEDSAKHNFEMLAQSLRDKISFASKEVEKSKADSASEQTNAATTQASLDGTLKSLGSDKKELQDLTQDCRHKLQDFEIQKKDREEELKALSQAKAVLSEKSTGAGSQIYSFAEEGASFLQVSESSHERLRSPQRVLHLVRNLGREHQSQQLMLLVTRMSSLIRSDVSETGVFDGIVKMVQDMIKNMQDSLQADTTKQAYCDKEQKKTAEKKTSKQEQVDGVKAKTAAAAAKSAQLKEEVQDLTKALSQIAQAQVSTEKVRADEKKTYETNYPEMQAGVEGVKSAIKILREFYQGNAKGVGIIGLLEVCEQDFSKALTEMKVAETTAQDAYVKESGELKEEKARKEKDVEYKTQAFKNLDKDILSLKSDSQALTDEMQAILEYEKGIQDECSNGAQSFEEKAKKRQDEIDGLKEALKSLQAATKQPQGASFLQVPGRTSLRSKQAYLRF